MNKKRNRVLLVTQQLAEDLETRKLNFKYRPFETYEENIEVLGFISITAIEILKSISACERDFQEALNNKVVPYIKKITDRMKEENDGK